MNPIDLRSDTVTRPTPPMRAAMAEARVGDDVFGEDPTVHELEAAVAEILGKEAALFVSSGTMGNQLAIAIQTRPGDEVIVPRGAHPVWYEAGAGAALSGVQFCEIGDGGLFSGDDVRTAVKPRAYYSPRTSLLTVENTHNRAGGRIFPRALLAEIASAAKTAGLAIHLDGARLWNASAATGDPPKLLAAAFDTVSVCFSKGLGAPVGSALAGPRPLIEEARRRRKMWGGGMRQSGILAAAALYALAHHRGRLEADHANAKRLARALATIRGLHVDSAAIETNIVHVDLEDLSPDDVAERARAVGLLVNVAGPRRLRLVTHLDVDATSIDEAALRLARAVGSLA